VRDQPRKQDTRPFPVPPLLYVVPLAVGVGMHVISPARFLPGVIGLAAGVPVIVLGVVLFSWAVATMYRAGTSPQPSRPVSTLVTWGPFRYSRNPIYVAYTLAYLGTALMVASTWVLALLPLALALVQWLSIGSEERYLEDRFGETYRDYKSRVRRWA